MVGTVLSTLSKLSDVIVTLISAVINPILHFMKLNPREIK